MLSFFVQARETQRREEQERLEREAAEAERKRKEEEEAREREAREAAEREAERARIRLEKALALGAEPEKGPDVTRVILLTLELELSYYYFHILTLLKSSYYIYSFYALVNCKGIIYQNSRHAVIVVVACSLLPCSLL